MAVENLLGRPVPSTLVLNRTNKAPFARATTIREEFPFVGVIAVAPGEVKEIPAEVAEVWCDPDRWGRQMGWPVDPETGKVIPPITKDIRDKVEAVAAPAKAKAVDLEPEDEDAGAVIEEKTPPVVRSRPVTPVK